MKLPIKREYFDKIKNNEKLIEFRDAHITFVAEDNGEVLRKDVLWSEVKLRPKGFHDDVLEDDKIIVFKLI